MRSARSQPSVTDHHNLHLPVEPSITVHRLLTADAGRDGRPQGRPDGSAASPNTVAKAYRLLGRIMDTAVEAGLIVRNPCSVKGAATEGAAEVKGHFTWGPPKTEAGWRTVTLPAAAAAGLAEHLGHLQPARPGGTGVHLQRGWAAAAQQLQPAGLAPGHPSGRPGGAWLP
jgi:hypothetical protein